MSRMWRTPFVMPFVLPLVLRLALRDLRGGFAGLRIFFACVALGVAAITGVTAMSQSLLVSFAGQGRILLGGDVVFSRSQRPPDDAERAFFASRGALAETATLRAMARFTPVGSSILGDASDKFSVIELKAVDGAYPLAGALTTAPALPGDAAFVRKDGYFGALAEAALIERLGLKIGDVLRISDVPFQLRGEIVSEPDRVAAGLGFGPRLMISTKALRESGLLKETTLARWSERLAMPATASDADIDRLVAEVAAKFPQGFFEARTRAKFSPQLTRNIERFSQFMALIGLVSLIIGGVGISGAVSAFVERKRETIAILKTLGASGGMVFVLVLTEMMIIAMLGALAGAAIGTAAPFLAAQFAGSLTAMGFKPVFSGVAIAIGLATGLLSALAFVIAPAGRAHDADVAALFRLAATSQQPRLRLAYRLAAVMIFIMLIAAVFAVSSEKKIAVMAMAGVAVAGGALRLVGWGVTQAAAHTRHIQFLPARMAIKNLHRPGAITSPVTTALGLGLTLLVTIIAVDGNIQNHLNAGMVGRTPDFFFLDVQSAQAADFRAFLQRTRPKDIIEETPMLRGRITRVGARSAEDVRPPESVAWVLEGDRGVTYAATTPPAAKVVEGAWWAPDYSGPPLVSIERDIARGLGLNIGDSLSVNVAGRNITATVANFRQVDWRTFGINFVLVFTPVTFAKAPHSELFSISSTDGAARRNSDLIRTVADAFPAVTTVSVRDALEAASALADKIALAIRAASSVTLVSALLVLGGALAAGQRARLYDAVVLRALGAARRTLLGAYVLEFLMLGVATSLFAVATGMLAAFIIVTAVMGLDFTFNWAAAFAVVIGGGLLTIALGLMATWRVLGEKPARFLREL